MKSTIPRFGVALLAAGASSRMGRPKLLLPWADMTVLAHLLDTWRALGATEVKVVVAPESPLIAELDRLRVRPEARIVNPAPQLGMFSSVQCAARAQSWNENLTHVILTLGDQPHLKRSTLERIVKGMAEEPNATLQPAYNGRARHPIAFPQRVWMDLGTCPWQTLREFLSERVAEVKLIDIADPGLDLDLDTPADYERGRIEFGGE